MIEFNKLFRQLIKEESLEEVPIKYTIKVFSAMRTLLESEEFNVSNITAVSESASESSESDAFPNTGNTIC